MVHTALATGAALVALAFALSTFERWLDGRRRHELAWSVALAMFAVASFALAAGAALGWNQLTFRIFYLFGAITNVPVLALGTVYLLGGRRRGDAWAVVIALVVAFSTGVLAVAPFRATLPADELAQGSEVFGPLPRFLAATASGAGAAVVVAGALWSAARARGRRRLVAANVLIAAGTVLTGTSGLLNSVLDEMDGFAVTLLAGVSVIFAGFLLATAAPRTRPVPAGSGPEPGALLGDEQELDQRRGEDAGQQDGQHDRRPSSHDASRVTASPVLSRSSSAADRRSSTTDNSP